MSAGRAPARVIDGRIVGAAFLDDPALQRVLAALDGAGEETRVVGGAVRNALLGRAAPDIDLATTATPDIVMARAKAAGLRTVPTGLDHGTVSVLVDGRPFETTTLREDIETDGRRALVRFGRDFVADALRRDFTINALSVDAHGRLYDHVGGLADIAARHVRFIGDARARIAEDYLRILRLFRFHAAYGEGPLDEAALDAAIALRAGLDTLSRERIAAELFKLIVQPGARDALTQMRESGLLAPLVGGVARTGRLARLIDVEAGEPDACLRLLALCVAVEEDAQRLREKLRLSNAQAQRLHRGAQALIATHDLVTPPAPLALHRLLFEHGRRAAQDALWLAHARSGAARDDGGWRAAHALLRDAPEPRLPFSGGDLVARGLPSGPVVGAALKRLQAAWIRAGFPKDPAMLARLLEDALADTAKR